jgi:hypothetical protein
MYCPEHKVFSTGNRWFSLSCWMYYRDVPRHTIPFKVWLNPLRYEFSAVVKGRVLFVANRRGMLATRFNVARGNTPC